MDRRPSPGTGRYVLFLFLCFAWTLGACQTPASRNEARRAYERILRLVEEKHRAELMPQDSLNFFDGPGSFDPFHDSLHVVLDSLVRQLVADSLSAAAEVHPQASSIRFNLNQARKVDTPGQHAPQACRQRACRVWAHVSKSRQRLYLYLDGQLVDSFKVSTGLAGEYETPSFDTRPSGPVFRQYTSRKFPGGNYMGLGNMPYAVFFSGGFAIHGTTPGNFSRLGNRASHGCIRLHPDNARLFFELIQSVGLRQAWVTVD